MLRTPEMFWRQLRFEEFDVSEMSLSSLIIATSRKPTPWIAIPILPERSFPHTLLHVRDGAGVETPGDLAGKRVGVPEYQQTSAVWSRAALQHDFGVDLRSIAWFMERAPEKSHGGATGFAPPAGIRLTYIAPDSNIGEMLVKRELDATLLYNPFSLVDRSRIQIGGDSGIRPLFPDPISEGARYFRATGIFPVSHCVIIRRSLYETHPWLALNVYNAFVRAKDHAQRSAEAILEPYFLTGLLDADARRGLDGDPFSFGIQASVRSLELLTQALYEQGLTNRVVGLDEVFAKQTLDL